MTTAADAHYCLFETAMGRCGIAWTPHGLACVQLPERDDAATERRLAGRSGAPAAPDATARETIGLLQRYFAGERIDFDALALDLADRSPFHQRIYSATRALRWGETATYGEIARRVGAPSAAQGVGQAMARNRLPIIIPCHRVLASGDKLGGFSAYGGVLTKRRLLDMEGIHPGSGTPPLPGLLSEP